MEIKRSIIVMNSKTWKMFEEEIIKNASNKEDPLAYLDDVMSMEIEIDETVEDGFVEIYEKKEI